MLIQQIVQRLCDDQTGRSEPPAVVDHSSGQTNLQEGDHSQSGNHDQETTLDMTLEDLDEAVACLMRLSDPLIELLGSVDSAIRPLSPLDDQMGTRVTRRFPEANSAIVERLARSMSDRRNEILTMALEGKAASEGRNHDAVLYQIAEHIAPVLHDRQHGGKPEAETSADDTSVSTGTSGYTHQKSTGRSVLIFSAGGSEAPTLYHCSLCRDDVLCKGFSSLRLVRFQFPHISLQGITVSSKHYVEDLAPYVCTFEGCPRPSRRYMSRSAWVEHIKFSHGLVWRCCFGCPQILSSRDSFEDHMREEHRPHLKPETLSGLADMCQKHILPDKDKNCPLCAQTFKSTRAMYRHIARHLEDLALLSLHPPGQAGTVATEFERVPGGLRDIEEDEKRKTQKSDVSERTFQPPALPSSANHIFDRKYGPSRTGGSSVRPASGKYSSARSYGSSHATSSTAATSIPGQSSTWSRSDSRAAPSTAATSVLDNNRDLEYARRRRKAPGVGSDRPGGNPFGSRDSASLSKGEWEYEWKVFEDSDKVSSTSGTPTDGNYSKEDESSNDGVEDKSRERADSPKRRQSKEWPLRAREHGFATLSWLEIHCPTNKFTRDHQSPHLENSPHMEPCCAICGAPPFPECPDEGERLKIALRQAEERWTGIQEVRYASF